MFLKGASKRKSLTFTRIILNKAFEKFIDDSW